MMKLSIRFVLCLFLLFTSIAHGGITQSGDVDPADPSSWTDLTNGYVGRNADGTLTLDGGSDILSSNVRLGNITGVTGTVTVTGSGSTWENSYSFIVGNEGAGVLSITDGGAVSSSYGYIGKIFDSTGTAIVSGSGSTWDSGYSNVGDRGNGTLEILSGGQVNSSWANVANYTNSTGTATVSGSSSVWNCGGLAVGEKGAGILNITGGGVVNVSGQTHVGRSSSGTGSIHFGEASITTPEGTLITGGLNVGTSELIGTGMIDTTGLVSDVDLVFDATHGLSQTIMLAGVDQNITIELTQDDVTGYDLGDVHVEDRVAGDLGAGYRGNGTLTIQDGMVVASANGYLGMKTGSTGVATVSGEGSSWTNENYLIVGSEGTGELSITDGGTVTNGLSYVGCGVGTACTVTVAGDGSTWTNNADLYLGLGGVAGLNVTDGGLVSVAGTLRMDAYGDLESFLNMSGGAMLALLGEADESLEDFLGLVEGTDEIRWWDDSLGEAGDWSLLTTAAMDVDYSLEYIPFPEEGEEENALAGYTLLTVGGEIAPAPGDANKDGKVDGSDVTILAGNWQHGVGMAEPDATWAMGDFNGDGKVDGSDVTILAGNWQYGVTSAANAVPEPGCLALLLTALLAGGALFRGKR